MNIRLYFYYIFLFELFLGGSGQEIHIVGPLTLRMLNFLVGIILGIICFLKKKDIPQFIITLLFFYSLLICFSLSIGLLNDAPLDYLFEDIKPLSYFYIIIYLYYMISTNEMVLKTYQVLLLSGKILITLYLIYILLTDVLGVFDFSWAYTTFENSDNIMFRGVGSAFYYKGFIFIPIATMGFLMEKKYLWFVLSVIAIYFTYTRGVYVLFLIGVIVLYLRQRKVNIAGIVLFITVIYVLFLLAQHLGVFQFEDSYNETREGGDELRFLTIRQVFNSVTVFSTIFGHGFGCGVETRPVHMEMSYLEIFHKQGIIGISFWLLVFYYVFRFTPLGKERRKLSNFFLIAALLIYIQSFFNPYINNPIGMGMVLISLVSRYRLSRNENTVRNSII